MIASVVATLTDDAQRSRNTLETIASRPEIEVGEVHDQGRRVPLTIDAPDQYCVERVTRWLQERPGIAFVDVIIVYLEEVEDRPCDRHASIAVECNPRDSQPTSEARRQ